jgi:hypothetical protein
MSLLHQRENNQDTENFLHANEGKFNKQNKRVLELLYTGGRWWAKKVNDKLSIADGGRRLREIFAAREECKREWGEHGKEYWLEIPKQPTKQSLQEWFSNYQNEQPPQQYSQRELF